MISIRTMRLIFAPACAIAFASAFANAEADERERDLAFFKERIEPVLVQQCYECHSAQAKEVEGSLRLDSSKQILAGGDTGPAIVPGDPARSLLIKALRHEDLEMPPDGPLAESIVRDFELWISSGAVMPTDESDPPLPAEPDYAEAREYWAFQPIRNPELPAIKNKEWAQNEIDFFVLHELENQQLAPSPQATRTELVRRVYFDLLGLPPTPGDVAAFVDDKSPFAYEQLVDRLLASPRYGEKWAQYWLDVVRYAESEGFEYDRLLPGAWRFRDYVIESFNDDKPYDQFVTEQLAGDEIDSEDPTLRVAAGFHRLGTVRRNAGNQLVASSRNEVLTERTDIVGAAFLGLTVGCARCHDHKFDPISQHDYYRLQAFLAATHEDNVVLASADVKERCNTETKQIQDQIDKLKELLTEQTGAEEQRTRNKILDLESQLPPPLPTLCSIKNDPDDVTPIHLLTRGNPDLAGPRVGMRPLGVLLPDDAPTLDPECETPRTQLAAWLTDRENPMTARVAVNRIWQQHFGNGLVATANDFGSNGQRPSHPDLLDHLASLLLDSNWQLKPLHRAIVLSSTYCQSSKSTSDSHAAQIDPDDRLLWRFNRRRLTSEEIRDAMLSIAGQLKGKAGGESVRVPVEQQLVDQLYKPSQWSVTSDESEHYRRSIYLLAKRNLRLPFMEVFDQPTAQTSCAGREQSTHAPQALELLNGRLSNELAIAFANRLRHEAGDDAGRQVELAFQLAAGRSPTDEERELSIAFIEEVSLREFALATFNLNAFLYVD
ncbi:MAG: PSD1 domain-containing protein [Planctomycetales bacterium]|nr:PSD1 domain-containing protein [Planctomycetales bacterium]